MGGFSKKYDKTEFIRRSNIIHNNIYDYTLSDYKNSRDSFIFRKWKLSNLITRSRLTVFLYNFESVFIIGQIYNLEVLYHTYVFSPNAVNS